MLPAVNTQPKGIGGLVLGGETPKARTGF